MSDAGDEPKSQVWTHLFNLIMLVIGASVLVWILRQTGWGELRTMISGIGSWGALIVGLDVCATCLDAAAIRAFMRPEARMISYWRVLGAQASGRAINVLTPLGALGEATKVTMLVSYAPRPRVLSSIVLYNLSTFYLQVVIMLVGTPITLLLVPLPSSIKLAVGVGIAALIAIMVAIAVVVHRGAGATVVTVIHSARLISDERATRWKTWIADVDAHLRELERLRAHGTHRGVFYVIASRLVVWSSTLVLMIAGGVDLNPALVIAVFSVGVLIQWIASIVPLGLGVADGGYYALFALLGASGAHGLFVTMLNRARSLAAAALGLTAMAITHTANRVAIARTRRKLRELRIANGRLEDAPLEAPE
jgi:hypothetical protein